MNIHVWSHGEFSKAQYRIKFIFPEKATKFCEISSVDLTVTTLDKSTVEILQKFVAFSEYMNFKAKAKNHASTNQRKI